MSLTTYYCIKLALLQYQATLKVQISLVFRSTGTENQDRLHTKVQVLYAIYVTQGRRQDFNFEGANLSAAARGSGACSPGNF